ncbi:Ppx/GppA family phosphatase [Pseudidiomarina insulisalsae]|uniref:Ppx/GppA family phosphatase n=1 Tax=Pseudidiomarina insulisalsae TaxID=575789 RepID=A0A432YQI9_9GAMM|nr:Ppx/GppA family phosphatase [Pseudidiomarina insulisalsae]RUO63584.1 Ppx/GppA family phosphatase [Pseudidiomarina insulisalsae]
MSSGNVRIAAIDLGSNSFHMLIAKATSRGYRILTRQRQKVRLADGLQADHTVEDAAIKRGVSCLQSFAELIARYQPLQVRCVATATLRLAKNRKQLLRAFEKALGFPIDVISGTTEASLIYQGATAELDAPDQPMLVLDIGGASTEVIAGVGTEPHVLKSLDMGCVVWQNRFFKDGRINTGRFQQATAAASALIRPLARTYKAHGWQTVCGASGTFRALQDRLQHQCQQQPGQRQMDQQFIRDAAAAAIAEGEVSRLQNLGIRDDRIAVFCGGLAILVAVVEELGIERIDLAKGALREGLVHTMLAQRAGAR